MPAASLPDHLRAPPGAGRQRIELVDALRGFALLGLFLVHCVEYFELYWMQPAASLVHDTVFLLFAGKAYAVFALLFGLSLYLLVDRPAAEGRRVEARFAWRMLILLGFGSLHALLYVGDILQVLAVVGLAMLGLRRLSDRALWVVSLLCIVQLPLLVQWLAAGLDTAFAQQQPRHWAMYGRAFETYAHADLAGLLAFNRWDGMVTKWAVYWESGRVMQMFALVSWGLLLGRCGFFAQPARFAVARGRALRWALVASLALLALQHGLPHLGVTGRWMDGMARWYLEQAIGSYVGAALTVLGVLVFVRGYEHAGIRRLLGGLAPAGRMSLTSYLAQALVCVPLFYPFGLGIHATIGQSGSLLLGLVVYALLALAAHAWLRQAQFGPVEWLWRAVTQCSWTLPLRRPAAAGAARA